MKNNYKLGSKVIMKKDHPCGSNMWTITRVGVDIKIKCDKCGATTRVNIKGWLFFSALFEGERV